MQPYKWEIIEIMIRIVKLIPVCLSFLLALAACNKGDKFVVKGVVTDADGQMMYLENVGVSSVVLMDSVKLASTGKFEFSKPRPEYPDFYRLRLNNQLINFAVDSTETISILADAGTFATSYAIEGSENCKAIKKITLAQLDANQYIREIRKEHEEKKLADSTFQAEMRKAVNAYKEEARKYIYKAPMSTAAYFALFQQIDGLLLFDLYDKEDSKAYAAVATSFDLFYPESQRSLQLHNLALQSIKIIRSQREKKIDLSDIKTTEVDYFDIALPELNGEVVKLSDAAKGKTVLINFTVYQTDWSATLNMTLGDLYTKYKNKGLEIYQVSLDSDLHYWKNIASKLPWICVRDSKSVYSEIASMYNVKQLPAIYILNNKGKLVKRMEKLDELEQSLKAEM